MKRMGLIQIAAALVIFLTQSSMVFGNAEYYTYGNYNDDVQDKSIGYRTSDDDPVYIRKDPPSAGPWTAVTITPGYSYAQTYGYANASTLRLGVNAWAISTPTNSYLTDAYMETAASNRFTVLAGNSGLNTGDKTTLELNVRLDGLLHAKSSQYPYSGEAHSNINGGLTIRDYGIQEDTGEGYITPKQASFGASGGIYAYDVNANYWPYSYYSRSDESWRIESNINPGTDHSSSWDTKDYNYYGYNNSLDTGWLTITFEAIVGHTLDLDAYLYAYVTADHDGEAWADFNNTFSFVVAPAQAGVALNWETPIQPVPLPSALPLLAFGLISLVGLKRRQDKK